ncbi:hypothetical protein ANO11243_004480 [Dothideomycetidae sp. 11243]|nr:hypothetical protein ANO11243_004480 [fungal sp. No.11243]
MQSGQDDVDLLNAAIDRIRKTVPSQPYIQTIPQDGARWDHHHRESLRVWRGEVPFARDERPDLQYQTWYYHEHGSDLVHLRIHSPPPESRLGKLAGVEPLRSLTGTPNPGPKKKISLADYKNHKNKTPGAETLGAAGQANGTLHPVTQGTSKSSRHEKSAPLIRDFAAKDGGLQTLKRKRSSDDAPRPSDKIKTEQHITSLKEARLRKNERSVSPTASRTVGTEPSKNGSMELPRPLSPLLPLMPGRLSPLGNFLPDRLSPDLPANIVAELDRRARLRETDVVKSPKKSSRHRTDRHNEESEGTVQRNRERRVEDGTADELHPVPQPSRKAKPMTEQQKSERRVDSPPQVIDKVHVEEGGCSRLMVRLKIPKRLRMDYRRLLQFRPRPASKISQSQRDHIKLNSGSPEQGASEATPAPQAVGDKTAIHNDSATTRKRTRPSPSPSPVRKRDGAARKEPITPLQAPFQSPPPPPSRTANHHATPTAKRISGTNMSRITSADGHAPSSAAATPVSSSSVSAMNSAIPKPSPTSGPSQPTKESEAWLAEHNRLLQLGKTLKSAAKQHEGNDATLALLTNIESLCAFMLAFHASDMNFQTQRPPTQHPPARRTWNSLHGFWKYVWDRCDKHPALKAAVGALGLVYLARICAWVAANSKEREKDGSEAVTMLSRIGAGPRVTASAARKLWPETWKKCMAEDDSLVVSGVHDDDCGQPGKYAGAFELPIVIQTPTLRAIRTTLAMLGEWKTNDKGKVFQTTLKLVN